MPRHQQVLRQWAILRLLERAPAGLTVAEIAQREGLHERSVYRDLQALEQAGFPLFNPQEGEGGRRWGLTETYRSGKGVPLALTEILALRCARSALGTLDSTPYAEALGALIGRLDALLTPPALAFARQMDEALVGDRFGRPEYGEKQAIVATLQEAMAGQLSVALRYRAQSGEETVRRVDPYNLWLHRGVLYLVAWCHLRREVRTFALARLLEVTSTGEAFTPLAGYDFESYSRQRFRIFAEGQVTPVRLRFAPEAATYVAERTWHPSQQITRLEGGGLELAMEVDGLTEVITWVISFGRRVRVLEPESLARRVEEELRAALAHYTSGEGGGERRDEEGGGKDGEGSGGKDGEGSGAL